ncbi:MAG: two-component regulator propeller domain-containing protein [bacterium]
MKLRTASACVVWGMSLLPLSAPAQSLSPRFRHLSIDDGLSQSTVLCALQDRRGFMWFGTQDGLNRYDGAGFKIYKHRPDDPNSLSENWVWSLFEDSLGYISMMKPAT